MGHTQLKFEKLLKEFSKPVESFRTNNFTLGNLVVERELQYPYFWLVKKNGKVIDRDQYSNDIEERFEMGVYHDM
jgi:hypothetical protein